jgi:hypothetical protein
VNLDQTALRNVLKRAINDEGYLRESDFVALKLKKIKEPKRPKRRLLAPAEFEQFLAAIPTALQKNVVESRTMCGSSYSGGREREFERRWKEDVVCENERVIGAASFKSRGAMVEFNEKPASCFARWRRRAPVNHGSFLRRSAGARS